MSSGKRCETLIAIEFDLPTENPDMRPLLGIDSIIVVKTSITNKKRIEDEGSPWRSPLEVKKYLIGDPLTRTTIKVEEMQ